MKTLFGISFLLLALPALGATTSRKATITCDFRKVATSTTGFAALGKLEFQVNLDAKAVPTRCLSEECALDGDRRVLGLAANLDADEKPTVLFSEDHGEVTNPRLVIWGGNGDDSALLVVLNYDNLATMTLFEDGNIDQSTKPVACEIKLKK